MASSPVEKRRDKRLSLTLPLKFFSDTHRNLSPREGITRNVSSGGVYFEAPVGQELPVGPVELRIGVPAHDDADAKPTLTLVGKGAVCRVEKLTPDRVLGAWQETHLAQGLCGIAIQFEQRPTIELQSLEDLLWKEHGDK